MVCGDGDYFNNVDDDLDGQYARNILFKGKYFHVLLSKTLKMVSLRAMRL